MKQSFSKMTKMNNFVSQSNFFYVGNGSFFICIGRLFPNFDMNGEKKMSPEVKMMQCLHCKGSGIFGVGLNKTWQACRKMDISN